MAAGFAGGDKPEVWSGVGSGAAAVAEAVGGSWPEAAEAAAAAAAAASGPAAGAGDAGGAEVVEKLLRSY